MNDENCLIIAGEKSGEEHALSFLGKIKELRPSVSFWGVGGDELEQAGVELKFHLKDFSSWGFSEVVGKIPFYFRALDILEKEALRRGTKVAILIDFQTFNLKLAKRLKKHGIKVLYYVAPQAWAWKEYRAAILEKTVHTLFTIIPFEKEWFKNRGVKKVMGVNHPLWMTYGEGIKNKSLGIESKPYGDLQKELRILILPGSRNFEVKHLLEPFLKVALKLKKERKVAISLVRSSNVKDEIYGPWLDKFEVIYENEQLSEALEWAHVALAASGTVTLACALFEVPTVVSYQTSLFNEWVFYTFINYERHFSLANIIHEKEVFPELVQEAVSPYNIERKLRLWINNEEAYNASKAQLAKTADLLQGDSSDTGKYMAKVLMESYER